MTRKQKKTLRRIGIAAVLFFALFLIPERCILPGWLAWLPFAPGIVDSAGNPVGALGKSDFVEQIPQNRS